MISVHLWHRIVAMWSPFHRLLSGSRGMRSYDLES
jgi:hypothetical protein